MAKTKDKVIVKDLATTAPKKSIFGKIFAKHSQRKMILNHMSENNIKNFLFYTNVQNILLILENGIKLVSNQNLKKGEEYTVWTYLENNNTIGLEYDSSTRAHFWKWAIEAGLNIEEVAVIGINPQILSQTTQKDWAADKATNIVYIYENIDIKAIEWIMVKDRKNLERIKTIVESNDLNINVYYGEKGNIKEEVKK
ncbi:hypothetical protein SSABA_v1c01330 [Spiroplasma sabaudiense Ar-1343]|uniref:Acetyltransferase n=1 Tax=Spiroplasma sabaudiense Ar-1343 TaxID=1276257 RepID=W6A9I5_9MOLU|nr:hypothetical protein [Spiroplasma sabaudiense]AHI53545.1 hypothetical protein SSABA_v1c01330 [Spiroplasma sabaudiense Ar-1343]